MTWHLFFYKKKKDKPLKTEVCRGMWIEIQDARGVSNCVVAG